MVPRTPAQVATALVTLALVATGCEAGPESRHQAQQASSTTSTASTAPRETPTPAERLHLTTGWGPTQGELDRAARIVRRMRLPQLAGQVIVASWSGTGAPTALVNRLHLGGVIAFTDNISSARQIRGVNARLQKAAPRRYPVWTSVDQEGGLVERVKGPATRFPSFMAAGAAHRADLTRKAYAASGAELRRLGFTTDYAPDADVTVGPRDPTIGARSAGSRPKRVAAQSTAAGQGFADAGVIPVLKHWPGHGSVPADSHETLPVQQRSRARLRATDFVPFAHAVEAGLPAIMVGHIDVRAFAPGMPSSLSRKMIGGVLRDELGFRGLVVTDSLEMAGVRARFNGAESAVRALRAGADVLLMPPDPGFARAGIVSAVRHGRLGKVRLQQAAARMVALLIHQAATPGHGALPGSARPMSAKLSTAATTSVAGPCRGRLFRGRLVPVGDSTAVANFRRAARAAGISLGRVTYVKPPRPPAGHRQALRAWRRLEPRAVVRGRKVDLVGYGDGAVAAPIVVSTDTPYVLGQSSARVRIAAYGTTPGAMRAVVRVLLGKAKAPGRLPVPVSGVPRRGCR